MRGTIGKVLTCIHNLLHILGQPVCQHGDQPGSIIRIIGGHSAAAAGTTAVKLHLNFEVHIQIACLVMYLSSLFVFGLFKFLQNRPCYFMNYGFRQHIQ